MQFKEIEGSYKTADPRSAGGYTQRLEDLDWFDDAFDSFKTFKFKSKAHVKEVQNEYMSFKLKKFEQEINGKETHKNW